MYIPLLYTPIASRGESLDTDHHLTYVFLGGVSREVCMRDRGKKESQCCGSTCPHLRAATSR